jgi:hypothetical protein
MDYTLLEDAYPDGGDFKTRTTVQEGKSEETPEARRRTNPDATKAVAKMAGTVPLETDPNTSNFKPTYGDGMRQVHMYEKKNPATVQEAFTAQSSDDDVKMKMNKILAMVEQNKTGYEPNSTNDMFLYILTGVMFLFTFDTFVMLGKTMRH